MSQHGTPERLYVYRRLAMNGVISDKPGVSFLAHLDESVAVLRSARSQVPPPLVYVRGDVAEAREAALLARIEKIRSELRRIFGEAEASEHSTVRVESMTVLADQALTEDEAFAKERP